MVCLAANPAAIYRPRQPRQSPLYKTILLYLPAFEQSECFESDGREFAEEATSELQLVLDPEFL